MRYTLILLITILLASCADLTAYVPGIDPTDTATPRLAPTATLTARPTSTAIPKHTQVWTVCTGLEGGYLNVRACAGTGCMSVAILREGREVKPAGVEEERISGRWMLITKPVQGWINARYLCGKESR